MARNLEAPELVKARLSLRAIGESEFHVEICGQTIGQIIARRRSFGRAVWFWSLSGPHLPVTMKAAGSHASTLPGAKTAIKTAFDVWLEAATGRRGNIAWEAASPTSPQ